MCKMKLFLFTELHAAVVLEGAGLANVFMHSYRKGFFALWGHLERYVIAFIGTPSDGFPKSSHNKLPPQTVYHIGPL